MSLDDATEGAKGYTKSSGITIGLYILIIALGLIYTHTYIGAAATIAIYIALSWTSILASLIPFIGAYLFISSWSPYIVTSLLGAAGVTQYWLIDIFIFVSNIISVIANIIVSIVVLYLLSNLRR